MTFHVGQRVVCVNDRTDPGCEWWPGEKLTVGMVYTVSDTGLSERSRPSIKLFELRRTSPWHEWYHTERFRPVHDTDISIFTAMLNPVRAREKV